MNMNGNKKEAIVTVLFILGLLLIFISLGSVLFNELYPKPVDESPVPELNSVVTPSNIATNWQGYQTAVLTKNTSLLSSPNGEQLAELESGASLIIMAFEDGWYNCRCETALGWIADDGSILPQGDVTLVESKTAVKPVALDDDAKSDIDAIFRKYYTVGGGVAIIENGQLAASSFYGVKTIGGDACGSETKFRVASITKLLVAMSAMTMAEDKRLTLDDDIGLYWGRDMRNPYAPDVPISFRKLLTHSSSLYFFNLGGYGSDTLLKRVSNPDAWFTREPGSFLYYSNAGIGLCAATLEKASGQTLTQYTGSYFFTPLGADASCRAAYIEARNDIAPCYKMGGTVEYSVQKMINTPDSDIPGDNYNYAGTLVISVEDLARLICVLANDGYYNGVYYMSPESVAEMETIQFDLNDFDQCIGVRYKEDLFDGRDLYYHPGLYYGVTALVSYDSVTGDGVVVVANGSGGQLVGDDGVSRICGEISEYCYSTLLSDQSEL